MAISAAAITTSPRLWAQVSATLRSEVDLAELQAHLLPVVEENMQPADVSLWLREPGHETTERAPAWYATLQPSAQSMWVVRVAARCEVPPTSTKVFAAD